MPFSYSYNELTLGRGGVPLNADETFSGDRTLTEPIYAIADRSQKFGCKMNPGNFPDCPTD